MVTALRIISVALMLAAATLALADEPAPQPRPARFSEQDANRSATAGKQAKDPNARVVDRSTSASGVGESIGGKDAEAGDVQASSMQADAANGDRSQHDAEKTSGNRSNLAPLPIKLPRPAVAPTPENLPPGVKVEVTMDKWRPRKPLMAPAGCVNVARGKAVTASDNDPVIGTLDMITDGDKAGKEDSYVELGPGLQWVQLDLGEAKAIHAVVLWHEHRLPIVYYDVVVQVADDKDFIENVKTIYNNDHDNSAGLGLGEAVGYYETYEGKLITAGGVKARYVRLYSKGNTSNELNRYTEVEVYAVKPGATKAAKKATVPARSNPSPLTGEGGPKGRVRVPATTPSTRPASANAKAKLTKAALAPLQIELPRPQFQSRVSSSQPPRRLRLDPNANKPRKPLLVPKGCVNLARGRPVTTSDPAPLIGEPGMIVDGKKEAKANSFVELAYGVQWVQIDLGKALSIYAVVFWHEHDVPVAYQDVIVQVSDDKDFIDGVRTLYNNDHDNSAGQGKGKDYEYYETYKGKLITAGGVKARYVRLYSKGNTSNELNRYTEVEVYAVKPGATKAAKKATGDKDGKQPSTRTRTRTRTIEDLAPLPVKLPRPAFY